MVRSSTFFTLSLLSFCYARPPPSIRSHENKRQLPPVTPEGLQATVNIDDLLAYEQQLEDFAYATPERNRLIGTPGHDNTINYLYDTVSQLGYYDVYRQPFSTISSSGNASLVIDDADQGAEYFDLSPSGSAIDTPFVAIPNLGCNASDFDPAVVTGKIALISRGTCQFGLKSALAGGAGATGVVIYNNAPGNVSGGTLSEPSRPEGPYPPSASISQEEGQAIVAAISGGTTVTGTLIVNAIISNITTQNVIAQSKIGDPHNVLVLGGHTDSVAAGPGINDDGSGTTGILDVAIGLTQFSVTNAVRFCWWAAEEEGLVGSTYYVDNLPTDELGKIRAYLNFDMIASPNYVYALYDGDGSTFNLTGPPGSGQIEALFQGYFTDLGLNYTATEFDERSDYAEFSTFGIPVGGIFTGAEGIKTAEEADAFGGEAGVAYDINYHGPGDNVTNLETEAFLINTKGIAYSVATYATSFEGIPPPNSTETARRRRREVERRKPGNGRKWEYGWQKEDKARRRKRLRMTSK